MAEDLQVRVGGDTNMVDARLFKRLKDQNTRLLQLLEEAVVALDDTHVATCNPGLLLNIRAAIAMGDGSG